MRTVEWFAFEPEFEIATARQKVALNLFYLRLIASREALCILAVGFGLISICAAYQRRCPEVLLPGGIDI